MFPILFLIFSKHAHRAAAAITFLIQTYQIAPGIHTASGCPSQYCLEAQRHIPTYGHKDSRLIPSAHMSFFHVSWSVAS